MANLSRIVNVQIALDTAGISKAGFSTMMIVGLHGHSLSRVDTITSVDDLTSMGFSETDPIYLAASAAFSQTPSPSTVKIGRLNPSAVAITVDEVVSAGVYTVTLSTKDINGNVTATPYSFTNSGGNAAAILAGLAALINAGSIADATVADSTMTLVPATAGADIKYAVTSDLAMAFTAYTETIAEAMAEIIADDNDFYGIVLADRTQANILSMAAWVETHIKLFLTSTGEAGVIDAEVTTDTAYKLKDLNYYRTAHWYHALASTQYLDAAIMARCFSIDPGGETWALKSLSSITTDKLTETQFLAAKAKNSSTFENVRNITVTQTGKVAAGEWIDVIRFRDWLQEEISTNVFTAMKNANKVAYTDAGIAIIEAQVKAALDTGVTKGGIAPLEYDADGNKNPSYVLTVPLASSISATVKASRILSDISFTARLAGAIHVANISGSLTYASLTTTDNSAVS